VLAASASDDRSNHDGTSRRTRGGAVTDTRDRALDVAAGAGNVAIPAALTGADVVASDLTQELLEAGERAAAARGAHLTWRTADAEALPFGDWEFDAVLSCVGVMFRPAPPGRGRRACPGRPPGRHDRRFTREGGPMEWDYLLLTITRR
jgi:SAM-dependent methyltransferase